MELEFWEKIKRLTLISIVSDDYLLETLVLKGGNAIDLIYKINSRASVDLDFSMTTDLDDLIEFESKLKKVFTETFIEENFIVFDLTIEEKPPTVSDDMKDFWGGYNIRFKIIEKEKFNNFNGDIDTIRRNAIVVGGRQQRIISIDLSKFEYCGNKVQKEIDGYKIYVYSPLMIVIEKLRSICQKMPKYLEQVKSSSSSARARDFYDIYKLINYFSIKLDSKESIELFNYIFNAKRVPLELLLDVSKFKNFHKPDFQVVRLTVKSDEELKDFDYYFDFVVKEVRKLKSFGNV